MEQGVNEVIVNELTIQFKNLGLIGECINDVKNALVDISKVYKEEQQNIDEAYQRGLTDAWEAARKIVCDEKLDWDTLLHMFNRSNFTGIFGDYSASEVIEKLKAYKEKQKADKDVKRGDVVIDEDGIKFWVTKINNGIAEGIMANGEVTCTYLNVTEKTGKHVDIDKILDEMKE